MLVNPLPYSVKFSSGWSEKNDGTYNFSASSESNQSGNQSKSIQKEQYSLSANKTSFHANGTSLAVIPPASGKQRRTDTQGAHEILHEDYLKFFTV